MSSMIGTRWRLCWHSYRWVIGITCLICPFSSIFYFFLILFLFAFHGIIAASFGFDKHWISHEIVVYGGMFEICCVWELANI